MRLGFLVLMGLPSSGKTTLAKSLLKNFRNLDDNKYHFIHICFDELLSFPNGNYESEWKTARKSLLEKIEKLVVVLKNKNNDLCPTEFISQLDSVPSRESDMFIILDDNMYFKSMRYSVFQIAKKYFIGFCQVYLNCSLENALLKNSLRGPDSRVPPHVIENMNSKIEPPNPKNNWEKYSLEFDSFCNLNEIHCKLIPILTDSLNNVFYNNDNPEKRDLSAIQCRKSALHQTDIALRRIIGFKVNNYVKKHSLKNYEFKEYVYNLNVRKSEILSDVKTGTICLPENVLEEINSDSLEKFQLVNFLSGYF